MLLKEVLNQIIKELLRAETIQEKGNSFNFINKKVLFKTVRLFLVCKNFPNCFIYNNSKMKRSIHN